MSTPLEPPGREERHRKSREKGKVTGERKVSQVSNLYTEISKAKMEAIEIFFFHRSTVR
jgi:hypothetical protein